MDEADRDNPEERFKVEAEIELRIIKLSPGERKIGLSWKALSDDVERQEIDHYRTGGDGSATLADLFHTKDANNN